MLPDLLWFLFAAAVPPVLTWIFIWRLRVPHVLMPARTFPAFCRVWAVSSAGASVLQVVSGSHLWIAAGGAFSSVVAVALWWFSRRRRDRARRSLGAKSRALRDALVRRMRETVVPRPVALPGAAALFAFIH